jgi:hypothetical protein
MAAQAHGWSNDETLEIASLIANNEALHGEVINMAAYFVGEALSGGAKSKADLDRYAIPLMAQALRKRFGEVLDRISATVYASTKRTKPGGMEGTSSRDIAGGVMMMASIGMQKVNWREIAKHNLGK